MSRIEENREFLNKLPDEYTGNFDEITLKIMARQNVIFQDISRSLAMIAEKCEPVDPEPFRTIEAKAEKYDRIVRVMNRDNYALTILFDRIDEIIKEVDR